MLFALGRSFGTLSTFDDCATFLTPVPGDSSFRGFHLVEFITFVAGSIETFRTITIAQFVLRDGQMTMPATHYFFPFRQELEGRVITKNHGRLVSEHLGSGLVWYVRSSIRKSALHCAAGMDPLFVCPLTKGDLVGVLIPVSPSGLAFGRVN